MNRTWVNSWNIVLCVPTSTSLVLSWRTNWSDYIIYVLLLIKGYFRLKYVKDREFQERKKILLFRSYESFWYVKVRICTITKMSIHMFGYPTLNRNHGKSFSGRSYTTTSSESTTKSQLVWSVCLKTFRLTFQMVLYLYFPWSIHKKKVQNKMEITCVLTRISTPCHSTKLCTYLIHY